MERRAHLEALVKSLTPEVTTLQDLAIPERLQDLLAILLPANAIASTATTESETDSWISRYDRLKQLYKAIQEAGAGIDAPIDTKINIALIAKQRDVVEIAKLVELTVCIALSGTDAHILKEKLAALEAPVSDDLQAMTMEKGIATPLRSATPASSFSPIVSPRRQMLARKLSFETPLPPSAIDGALKENLGLHGSTHGSPIGASPSRGLQRQYTELQNQFLVAETQIAEQDRTIEKLTQELAALRRAQTVSPKQDDASNTVNKPMDDTADRLRRLENVNEKYKRKLKQSSADTAVLEQRIDQLEHLNSELELQLKTQKAVPAAIDLPSIATVNEPESTISVEIAHDTTECDSFRTRTRDLLLKQDKMIKGYRQKLKDCSASPTPSIKEPRTTKRELQLLEENKLIATAFYDLASRLQQSDLTLQRANASPKSFLGSRRLALGVLAPHDLKRN